MFKNPFSFEGRIRRSEYGITTIIFVLLRWFLTIIVAAAIDEKLTSDSVTGVSFIFSLPLLWFYWAQGAKRCHDVGNSGWFQLIPFYVFWMLFQDGENGANVYGENPKNQNISYGGSTGFSGFSGGSQTGGNQGYSGNYNGGHNAVGSASNNSDRSLRSSNGEYGNGDLYN